MEQCTARMAQHDSQEGQKQGEQVSRHHLKCYHSNPSASNAPMHINAWPIHRSNVLLVGQYVVQDGDLPRV